MKSLKSSALREKSAGELKTLVAEKNEALFNLKLRHAAGGRASSTGIRRLLDISRREPPVDIPYGQPTRR